MKFLNRYNKEITFRLKKPRNVVEAGLKVGVSTTYNSDHILVVRFKPRFFNAATPGGNILVNFNEQDDETTVTCKLRPTVITNDSVYKFSALIGLSALFAFFLSFSWNTLLVVITGVLVLAIWAQFAQTLSRGKMEAWLYFRINSIKSMRV